MRFRNITLYWLPVILWMGLIFGISTDTGSEQRTSRFIGPLLRWFKPDISEGTIRIIQTAARKSAHLAEYGILALLIWRALRKPVPRDPRLWSWNEAWRTLIICALYAASDEYHQSFYPSRYASPMDVLIDTCGAAAALFVLWLFFGRRR